MFFHINRMQAVICVSLTMFVADTLEAHFCRSDIPKSKLTENKSKQRKLVLPVKFIASCIEDQFNK